MRRRDVAALAVVAALVIGGGAAAGAAAGGNLVLGQFNTAGRKTTGLWANTDGPVLRLKQARPGQPALEIVSGYRGAPMQVDSSFLVDNLNTDMVDGFEANQMTRIGGCRSPNATEPGKWTCFDWLTAPMDGFVALGASAEAFRTAAGPDLIRCRILQDDAEIWGTKREVVLDGAVYPSTDAEANCSTDGTFIVMEGFHVLTFEVSGLEAGTELDDAAFWYVYSPFNGVGDTWVRP